MRTHRIIHETGEGSHTGVPYRSRLILFYSAEPHDAPPPYLIRLAERMATKHPVIVIDMPTTTITVPLTEALKSYYRLLCHLVTPKRILFWQPSRRAAFALRIVFWAYLWFYKHLFHAHIVKYSTYLKNDPALRLVPADISILDCYDNPNRTFTGNRDTIRTYDVVLAHTPRLFRQLRDIHPQTYMVSAGYHDYTSIVRKKDRIDQSVVFFGGISHRIDYDLLWKTVTSLRTVQFFFIGETYLGRYYTNARDARCMGKWHRILTSPNVHYLDIPIPPDRIQSILSAFRTGIIPYDPTDTFTQNSHPIKLYDYLASGCSVVSTGIPSVTQYAHLPISVADTPEAFIRHIRISVTGKDHAADDSEALRSVIRKHSLTTKLRQIEHILSVNGI